MSSGRSGLLFVAIPLLLLAELFGCGEGAETDRARRELPAEPPPSSLPSKQSPVVLPAGPARPPEPVEESQPVLPAAADDRDYRGDELVSVMRLVYRVAFRVPPIIGEAPATMSRPTAELHIDVSADRLRARFAGPGWPVAAGSEVRLRRDLGGAYVFDGDGGRPVGPGMLAAWFQGGSRGRGDPAVAIRRAPPQEQDAPGDLICALIAEWAGIPRTDLERRCGDGGAPLMFRIGAWRGDRTAEVPGEVLRRQMRVDHLGAPPPLPSSTSREFMETSFRARIPLSRRLRRGEVAGPPTASLRVENMSATRVVVVVGGVPVGWIDRGATADFGGFVPGEHTVGAMRPLGNFVLHGRSRELPGELRINPRRQRTPP